MLLAALARASTDVGGRSGRLVKIARLAECLRDLRADEIAIASSYLAGALPQGAIGVGWASVRDLPLAPAAAPTLEIVEVDALFTRIAGAKGGGSQARRRALLGELFGRATEEERSFLLRLLAGELRQGALEGVMVDAIARAFAVPPASARRALMIAGDLGVVASAALSAGEGGLAGFRLAVLRPMKPMLAETATDVRDALARFRPAAIEWKLDGARIQVHRAGDEVRVFTRTLADITARVPEIVLLVRALDVSSVVLDGEAIALSAGGHPHPFQTTMSRFGTRLDVPALRAELPLSPFFFDCLHLDGEDLFDLPLDARLAALARAVPEALRVPRLVTADVAEAEAFVEATLARGHEGVMVKALDAPYEAGRRGAGWLKVKRASTLDLVVLAAEWGHGRRAGKLSNLHLGARDPEGGGFVMLGKTFKGMTDETLAWQTTRLLELETARAGIVVHVRPELVVEVAFDGLQASARYPAGLTLRFARIRGYRADKPASEADTLAAVRALHLASGPRARAVEE